MLEMRADSIVYRAGLAATHRAARQMVSHGHVLVNGTRTTTPSYQLKKGDSLTVREGSRRKTLFSSLSNAEEGNTRAIPPWITFDLGALQIAVEAEPSYTPAETILDYPAVFEFYSR